MGGIVPFYKSKHTDLQTIPCLIYRQHHGTCSRKHLATLTLSFTSWSHLEELNNFVNCDLNRFLLPPCGHNYCFTNKQMQSQKQKFNSNTFWFIFYVSILNYSKPARQFIVKKYIQEVHISSDSIWMYNRCKKHM